MEAFLHIKGKQLKTSLKFQVIEKKKKEEENNLHHIVMEKGEVM